MLFSTSSEWHTSIRVDMNGAMLSTYLKRPLVLVLPKNLGWLQEPPDSMPTLLYTTIPIISKQLPEAVICHFKWDCTLPFMYCLHGQPYIFLCKCKVLCSKNGYRSGKQTYRECIQYIVINYKHSNDNHIVLLGVLNVVALEQQINKQWIVFRMQ